MILTCDIVVFIANKTMNISNDLSSSLRNFLFTHSHIYMIYYANLQTQPSNHHLFFCSLFFLLILFVYFILLLRVLFHFCVFIRLYYFLLFIFIIHAYVFIWCQLLFKSGTHEKQRVVWCVDLMCWELLLLSAFDAEKKKKKKKCCK